ncbi:MULTISPECIES: FKBP-type peptidyl-prolyl cis-trans isomerase [unclassified Gordonia (in: high G+C Gram-positive bacteria)]|uniref:FKBP-type peptidyl-prolyl cis-trans isomerase n=1 Tax=unclassified Gordonia (in: high G+C Gram-positive bacteria) TaxID=2657482 RepID=UPI001F0F2D04|nr:FKBP-type peptidyl-prolyl cis-trans isomerase [Gordonia sp. ABSL49_1]MCH5642615.1 FKBP-type peptidyl-prolyl cis-trans isomerase [Gordonia sp. ABSL49_1]
MRSRTAKRRPRSAEVVALAIIATVIAVFAAGCSSDDPADPPSWTFQGTTGTAEVVASTDTAPPKITITAPFAVTETQVHTLETGSGAVVSETSYVTVNYEGVNGRDGRTFDSSYQRGQPAPFGLGEVVPGFRKAIAGQKVGSRVAVAMAPADAYPNGAPDAGIQPGDTLVFEIAIISAE